MDCFAEFIAGGVIVRTARYSAVTSPRRRCYANATRSVDSSQLICKLSSKSDSI